MSKPFGRNRDVYYMTYAMAAATLGTCLRKKVGCVLVDDGGVFSEGYNSALAGEPHCDDTKEDGAHVGCMMEDGHCVRVLHAEVNAIIRCAREGGRSTKGATIYVSASPCWSCFKAIVNAGIKRVVYGEFYRDERIFKYAKEMEIELTHLRTCCPWHLEYPGPWKKSANGRFRNLTDPETCRCGKEECSPCSIEQNGCGCDGSLDDGCFLCTPSRHKRPECKSLKGKAA